MKTINPEICGNDMATICLNQPMYDHLTVGLLLIDKSGYISDSNQFINVWLGMETQQLNGLKLDEIISVDDCNLINTQIKLIRKKGSIPADKINVEMICKNQPAKRGAVAVINDPDKSGRFVLLEVTDDEKIAALKNELKSAKEFQRLVADNNKDLIFVKDEQFRIVFANKAFLSIYPKEQRKQVIGYTTLENYHADDAKKFTEQDSKAFRLGSSKTIETINLPNGEKRILETSKTKFIDSDGVDYILGVSRDVTESNQMIDALEKSNHDLNQFAYVASHDLKSPANAINQIVGWLQEDCADTLSETGKKHLELLQNRSNRMITLLDDLLGYSRFNHGKYDIRYLSLQSMVDHILELRNPTSHFNVHVGDINFSVPYAPLEIILRNLIFNAIKHHDQECGNIYVNLTNEGSYDQLMVADDGPGIPVELYGKAIELFQTLKPRDQVEGSGMGLAMVRKIVTMYHGTLELHDALQISDHRGLAVIIKWPKDTFINWREDQFEGIR